MTTKTVEKKAETPADADEQNGATTRERRSVPERAMELYQNLARRKIKAKPDEIEAFNKVSALIEKDKKAMNINRMVSDFAELQVLISKMSEDEAKAHDESVQAYRTALLANL